MVITSNDYLTNSTSTNPGLTIDGSADWIGSSISYKVNYKSGISPVLYFKYIKKKFGILEKMRLDRSLKNIEKAFYKAIDNGQEALGEKILLQMAVMAREAVMTSKGIKLFIEKSDIDKHKHNIRDGHISDTLLKNYTRIIPKKVLEKKKKVECCFDDFVIYHYWDHKAEEKIEKKQKMNEEEKSKMKDPVLFGIIKENNRLYFVGEWIDSYCDLSFSEIVDVIGTEEKDIMINKNPKFSLTK